jgi:enoyl-CoA hydratase/carnithine racemase
MSAPLVRVEKDGAATTITLANPDQANAITVTAMQQLIDGLTLARDEQSLLVMIRSDGTDFTVGRDQSEKPIGITRAESLGMILTVNDLLRNLPGVSITLVRGRALGFGSGLAVQSDITIAASGATFGFDEVHHGLAPLVVAEYLPAFIGPKATAELILTGRLLNAEEALRLGLVSRVVADDQLEATAKDLLADLSAYEPGALRLMKRYLHDLREGALADPPRDAVAQLDTWLAAGKPAHPRSLRYREAHPSPPRTIR